MANAYHADGLAQRSGSKSGQPLKFSDEASIVLQPRMRWRSLEARRDSIIVSVHPQVILQDVKIIKE